MENGVNANLLRKWVKAKPATRAKRKTSAASGESASKLEASNALQPIVGLPLGTRVWLAAGITDIRKGVEGVAALVQTAR